LGTDINANTRNNNNEAWRNTEVVALNGGKGALVNAEFILRNISENATTVDLTIADVTAGGDSFWNHGTVYLDLGTNLFSRWVAAGAQGSAFQVVTNQGQLVLQLMDPQLASIRNIPLKYNEEATLTLMASAHDLQVGAFDVDAVELVNGDAVGGIAIVLDTDRNAPTISTAPTNQTVPAGGMVTISVTADGTGVLYYQWYLNGVAINGATGAVYTITGAQPSDQGNYSVVIGNIAGLVTNPPVTLTLLAAPGFTTPPQSQTVACHSNVVFAVGATGAPPLSYQWTFGSAAIAGATDPALVLTNVTSANAGLYAVVVSNSVGVLASSDALLVVVGAPPTLTISLQPPNVVIQWPPTCGDYSLEETADLGQAVWIPNPAPINIVNGDYTATIAIGSTNKFFRLRAN
jgi:hypothetical protein